MKLHKRGEKLNINEFRSKFQLVGTRVKKFSLKNDFVTLDPDLLSRLSVDVGYSIESIDKQNEYIVGIIVLNVKASVKDKGKSKVSISMSIEGCFISPPDEQNFETLLGINGCASLYSIARAYIHSVSSQSFSGGHIILPMINTIILNKLKKEEQNIVKD